MVQQGFYGKVTSMLRRVKNFLSREDGAVTVDWVVLTAAVVGLLAAGYGMMRSGTTDLSEGVSTYMGSAEPGDI